MCTRTHMHILTQMHLYEHKISLPSIVLWLTRAHAHTHVHILTQMNLYEYKHTHKAMEGKNYTCYRSQNHTRMKCTFPNGY